MQSCTLQATEEERVDYAFNQCMQPIFKQIDTWVRVNRGKLTMQGFYHVVEHYMGIPILAAKAKRDLATITMNVGERVDEFYHRLLALWEDADTPEDESMAKFEETLRPSIARTIYGHSFADMEAMLIKARAK